MAVLRRKESVIQLQGLTLQGLSVDALPDDDVFGGEAREPGRPILPWCRGSWRERGRRLTAAPSFLTATATTGVLIWLVCVLSGDDFFAAVLPAPAARVPGESLSDIAVAPAPALAVSEVHDEVKPSLDEEAMKAVAEVAAAVEDAIAAAASAVQAAAGASSHGGFVDESHAGSYNAWQKQAANDTSSTQWSWSAMLHHLNYSFPETGLGLPWSASDDRSSFEWLPHGLAPNVSEHFKSAFRRNFSQWLESALGQNATEQLRRKGETFRKESEIARSELQRKRLKLRQQRAQLKNSSLELVGAISTGEVQQSVVLSVVGSFVVAAIALQLLASARGRLRQIVRQLTARVLLAAPAPNELITRPYSGWTELAVRVSIDFLNEPANVMLLSIGSLQVLATWVKSDPLRCKKINLLVLLLNFAYTMVQEVRAQLLASKHDAERNLSLCSRVVGNDASKDVFAKDVQVGDVLRLRYGEVCPASSELVYSSHSFVLFNSLCETGEDCCTTLAVGGTVMLGFILAVEQAEVHVRITETRNCCSLAASSGSSGGEALPLKCRRMERFPEHMNAPLTQANLFALAQLFVSAVFVCALSYQSGATTTLLPQSDDAAPPAGGLSSAERLLITYFFSTVVQLNTVIPSMRWVVLFFMYIFLLEVARPKVQVQNWRALRGLEDRRILYSDKTGTLTEVELRVRRLRRADQAEAARAGGADLTATDRDLDWLAVVLMACNDSQQRPRGPGGGLIAGRRPGTSPEEIAIAHHLEDILGLMVCSNPLRPGSTPPSAATGCVVPAESAPLVLRDAITGREVARATVVSRSDFAPAVGFREATLRMAKPDLQGSAEASETWIIRQGGADIMAELAGRSQREAELAAEDKDRALGWCVARLGTDGSRIGAWKYVLRTTFENPPRAASRPLVEHCHDARVAVRMLTGDAHVAALHIAKEIGILPEVSNLHDGCVCEYRPSEAPADFSYRLQRFLMDALGGSPRPEDAPDAGGSACTVGVAVPGALVRKQIEANDGSDAWLADERVSAVIYRTRAADKAFIVKRTEELGRARRHAAARRRDSCICGSRVRKSQEEEGICMMMGDAANDAEAIALESVVGFSLQHGAAPCKLSADFVIEGPGALADVRTELHGCALVGARWLLEDVCFLCGLVSSLTLCGVLVGGLVFLPHGFLFDDPFDARLMTLFSSVLYAPSACAAACRIGITSSFKTPVQTSASKKDSFLPLSPRSLRSKFVTGASATGGDQLVATRAVLGLLTGVALGCTLGFLGPVDDINRFGRWILTCTSSVVSIRHTVAAFSCSGRTADLSAADKARAAAIGPPSAMASVLARASKWWFRATVLSLYLLLVWM
eukprot:TRINITY_DN62941_c0_g1_i1.p1 TRINITY_DN62941_c0_g1~~TRINITY_DN62941_c0_g1_i1.p1  ORF type:complete len:1350 (-),score=282.67 TRINITY_DN62941_c0_g1_i1:188-4237(-)